MNGRAMVHRASSGRPSEVEQRSLWGTNKMLEGRSRISQASSCVELNRKRKDKWLESNFKRQPLQRAMIKAIKMLQRRNAVKGRWRPLWRQPILGFKPRIEIAAIWYRDSKYPADPKTFYQLREHPSRFHKVLEHLLGVDEVEVLNPHVLKPVGAMAKMAKSLCNRRI